MIGDGFPNDIYRLISEESARMLEKLRELEFGNAIAVLLMGIMNQVVIYRIVHQIPLEEILKGMDYLKDLIQAVIVNLPDDITELPNNETGLDWKREFDREFKDT